MLPAKSRERLRTQGVFMVQELNTQLTQHYVIGEIAVPVHAGVGELSGAHAQRAAELTVQEAREGHWCGYPESKTRCSHDSCQRYSCDDQERCQPRFRNFTSEP